jgi:hypothetical protein
VTGSTAAGKNRYSRAILVAKVLLGFGILVFGLGRASAIESGMPNPPSSPTVVKVGILVADIIELNEVDETFQAEIVLVAEWNDPRLAFDPAEEGADVKLFQGQFQFNEVFAGWWPQLIIVNEIGSGDVNAITIRVHSDGRVHYLEQRNVTLETPMKLQPFPFDTQVLEAKMIAFGNYSDEVVLEVDEQMVGATEEHVLSNEQINIAQWRLINLDQEAELADFRYYGRPKQISVIRFNVTLERESANIIWKVIIPLIVLVLLMWAVFWMEVDNLSDRLNISFIGILTIVAYQFLIDGTMPRISYFTFTDTVLLYSFLVMCLAIVESLVLYSLCKAGRKPMAETVDRVAQWMFPILYFAGLLISYLYYTYSY